MNLSFSTRFENVMSIKNALLVRDHTAARAGDEAKSLEDEIAKRAASEEEYKRLCLELIDALTDKNRESGANSEDKKEDSYNDIDSATEILNQDGPTIGRYGWATFHQDGQMSTIFKARAVEESAPYRIVALKVTTPATMSPPHDAEREARILTQARHDHIVPLLDSFWHHHNQFVLVFPFLRQELGNLLRSGVITALQKSMVLDGLMSALEHLHSLAIIHRDVKPTNILLRSMDGPVYLADFGISWSPSDSASEPADSKITDVGTTCYRAPELLFGNRKYDASLDMWAAGCVIAEMYRRGHEPLFDAGPLGSELGLIKSIFTTLGTPDEHVWPSATTHPDWGKVRFQIFPARPWSEILDRADAHVIDFVSKTVMYEAGSRLTATEALTHPINT